MIVDRWVTMTIIIVFVSVWGNMSLIATAIIFVCSWCPNTSFVDTLTFVWCSWYEYFRICLHHQSSKVMMFLVSSSRFKDVRESHRPIRVTVTVAMICMRVTVPVQATKPIKVTMLVRGFAKLKKLQKKTRIELTPPTHPLIQTVLETHHWHWQNTQIIMTNYLGTIFLFFSTETWTHPLTHFHILAHFHD